MFCCRWPQSCSTYKLPPTGGRVNVSFCLSGLTASFNTAEFAMMLSCCVRWLLWCCIVPNLFSSDWPQWRGPFRTGHVPESTPVPISLPSEGNVVWRAKIGEGLASPVIAGDVVVYADDQRGKETVHAANLRDGKLLWSAPLDDAFKDSQGPQGPRCTPVIDQERIYAQSCKGELLCLALRDGKQLWRANYVTDFGAIFIGEKGQAQGATRHGYNGSPVIDGDRLVAMAGGTNGASLVCFDKFTGRVLWESQNDVAAYAPLIIAQIAGSKEVIAFTAVAVIGVE